MKTNFCEFAKANSTARCAAESDADFSAGWPEGLFVLMALNRNSLTLPVLPSETVAVDALGGDVVVRGLKLSDRLAIFSSIREDGKSYAHLAKLLAASVVGDDGLQLLNESEWDAFGGVNFTEALALFNVASRLSGLDAEVVEKN